MKKKVLFISLLIFASAVFAQAPQAINYQAVARDAGGNLIANQNISFRLSILQGGPAGAVVYSESHLKLSNQFGLVTLEIGRGTVISGVFSDISWRNGPYYIKTEMDPTGGTSYQEMGETQFISVPYALYCDTANYTIEGIPGPQGDPGPPGPPGGPANTLDMAYDQGGAGFGRFITADAGAVHITVPAGIGTDGLISTMNGTGDAIVGWSNNTGYAGNFYNSTGEDALFAEAKGTGIAGDFWNTQNGYAIVGQADGSGCAGWFHNSQNGDAVYAKAGGSGYAGRFWNYNNGYALLGYASGTGCGGYFYSKFGKAIHGVIDDPTNASDAIYGETSGGGNAGYFTTNGFGNAVRAEQTGNGNAVYGSSEGNTAYAGLFEADNNGDGVKGLGLENGYGVIGQSYSVDPVKAGVQAIGNGTSAPGAPQAAALEINNGSNVVCGDEQPGVLVIGYNTYIFTVEVPSTTLAAGWVGVQQQTTSPTFYWLNTSDGAGFPAYQVGGGQLPDRVAMCMGGGGSLLAQVFSPAGAYYTSANATLSLTVGESVIETYIAQNNVLNTGFQQVETFVPLTKIWNGNIDDNWNVAGNWTAAGVPVSIDNVTIPAAVPRMPLVRITGLSCRSVGVATGASLTINPGSDLRICGN